MLKKASKRKEKQEAALKNGAKLLEERIATAFGRDNPIKIFSADQIQQAIESHKERNPRQTYPPSESIIRKPRKGILDDRTVLIQTNYWMESRDEDRAFRNIVVSSMMSSHRNVLKLLGCCLEFPVPALVYEDAEKGCLSTRGYLVEDGSALSWKNRLKIAKEIASAVAYMHSAFPTRIIHRNIKPTNIFVNQDYAAKLTNFALSISIPEGEPNIEDVVAGTFGFVDPAYNASGLITEKTDVYSFGVLLLLFLTGKPVTDDDGCTVLPENVQRLLQEGKFNEVVDPAILGNVPRIESALYPQLQAFVELAQTCVKLTPEDRPSMTQMAREVLRIEKSIPSP